MSVANHRLTTVEQRPSPNVGGRLIDPKAVVIHYTAGRGYEASLRTLRNAKRPLAKRVSAHLLIGRDGECAQLVPFNLVAWHAGRSEWNGRPKCNRWMLGIELDNYGLLKETPRGFVTYFGVVVPPEQVHTQPPTNGGVAKHWHAYSEAQLAKLDEVLKAVLGAYGSIAELVGHEHVSPGRKTDPGPAFPWERYKPLLARA